MLVMCDSGMGVMVVCVCDGCMCIGGGGGGGLCFCCRMVCGDGGVCAADVCAADGVW